VRAGKTSGAQFEISLDGKPRSHRDRKDIAIEVAEFLKRKFPNCDVVVKEPAERGGDGGVQARHWAALMPL
jgi:hypothetical protein